MIFLLAIFLLLASPARAEVWLLTIDVPYSYMQAGVRGMTSSYGTQPECLKQGFSLSKQISFPIRYRIWGRTKSDPGEASYRCERLDTPPAPVIVANPTLTPAPKAETPAPAIPQGVYKWKDEKGVWHFQSAPLK